LNLIFNANAGGPNTNVPTDALDKYPGYTHMALRVTSIPATIGALKANDIAITEGPVRFGESACIGLRPRSGSQHHRAARPAIRALRCPGQVGVCDPLDC